MGEGPASAASRSRSSNAKPSYSKAVQDVLTYLESHPLRLESRPMIYEAGVSTEHLPPVLQRLTADDVIPHHQPGAATATSAGNAVALDQVRTAHNARVVAALLFVSGGGLDQAHNLVTPLCWGAATHYAGRPVAGSPAAQDASYVHALVHRGEGLCDGEFGSGFSNANYWYAATGPHPIFPGVLQAAKDAARELGDLRVQTLADNHGSSFSPSKFIASCAQAASSKDATLRAWCERVMQAEWRLLLDHCCSRL